MAKESNSTIDEFMDMGSFRAHLTDVIGMVGYGAKHIIVTRRGCPVAKLIGLSDEEKARLKVEVVATRKVG